MFSQASVCPGRGGVCVQRAVCPGRGVCGLSENWGPPNTGIRLMRSRYASYCIHSSCLIL